MRRLKLILIVFIINSCKGQNDTPDLMTTWYEIKNQGNDYFIVDCGYFGESFKLQNDSIFDHGIMEDSSFKIHHIVKENDKITSIYINEKEKYDISWIDKSKGIIKRTGSLDGSLVKYYVNEKNLNKIDKVKGTSKDCISSDEFDIEESKTSVKNDVNYSVNGTWMTNCDQGGANIIIENKNASFVLLYNQIYIELIEVKRYDFEKGIAYKLKEIPDDIGSIGLELNWKEYLNDEPIAYIKKIDDNNVYFYWYGFYNKKTKKREFKDNSFYQETGAKDIILKKCND